MVAQDYNTEAHNVYVIIGNAALLKCEIPSFVADFVSVSSWTDDLGNEFFPSDKSVLGSKAIINNSFLGCHTVNFFFSCFSRLRGESS